MADVARVTEISAKSEDSFEAAIETGIARATRTLRNVESAWVKDFEVEIDDDEIDEYKVKLKITFDLEE